MFFSRCLFSVSEHTYMSAAQLEAWKGNGQRLDVILREMVIEGIRHGQHFLPPLISLGHITGWECVSGWLLTQTLSDSASLWLLWQTLCLLYFWHRHCVRLTFDTARHMFWQGPHLPKMADGQNWTTIYIWNWAIQICSCCRSSFAFSISRPMLTGLLQLE